MGEVVLTAHATLVRVVAEGETRSIDVAPEETLLDALQRAGIPIATACGAIASCGLCRVDVRDGFSSLPPPRVHESDHLEEGSRQRLACQIRAVPGVPLEVEIVPP